MIGVGRQTVHPGSVIEARPHADYASKIAEVIDELRAIAAEDPGKKEHASA